MRSLTGVCILTVVLGLAAGPALAQSDRLTKSIKLRTAEKRTLDASVPPGVRSFLETADRFEVFAQLQIQDDVLKPAMDRELVPNFAAKVMSSDKREGLLRALYSEASKGEAPAVCYLPSHSIVAQKGDQSVTVEICFGCNRFYVSGALGKSEGTFSRASGETERLVSELIASSGVTIK